MSEFFESEEVTKGFDPEISRRILGYVKPYWTLALAALIALALSTLGELALPLLSQRIIDSALMPSFRRIKNSALSAAETARLGAKEGPTRIAEWDYYRAGDLKGLSGAREAQLIAEGSLDRKTWYLFTRKNGVSYADMGIELSDSHGAIRKAALEKLPAPEARLLRGADLAFLNKALSLFALVLVLVLATTFTQSLWTNLIGQRVMKDIRMELFSKTMRQSLAFLSKQPVGRLVTRMTSDVETINEFFTSVVVAFMKDLSVMAGVIIAFFLLDPRLGLITILSLPPILVATLVARVKARDAFRKQRSWLSKVNAFIAERLSGIQVVKLFVREKASLSEFEERNQGLLAASLGEMNVFATFRPLVDLFASISTGVVIYFGASLFIKLSISLGTLIAFINLIRMFYSPVMDISEKYTLLQSAMAGGERVFALLDANERIPDLGKKELAAGMGGGIVFKDLRFSYKKGEEVIRGLSFGVKPGELVAIVGYTGAGKTTIANLITRLYDADSGSILIDGTDIRDIKLDSLRRAIQPVPQDVFLFSGSVTENISLGAPMDMERIRAAATTVGAHEFIMSLPHGYETKLSEGATNISSGQRQLISFARVVAQDPCVIILDEATSSIDTETERLIQRGLEGLLKGRTSIVIAHRLSTIQHAHRILVLGHGKLLEEGSHQELLVRHGIYYELYRLQYESGAGKAL